MGVLGLCILLFCLPKLISGLIVDADLNNNLLNLLVEFGAGETELVTNEDDLEQQSHFIKSLSTKWMLGTVSSEEPVGRLPETLAQKIGVICWWSEYTNNNLKICQNPSSEAFWLLVVKAEDRGKLMKQLNESTAVNINSNIVVAAVKRCVGNITCTSSFFLDQVYKVHKNASLTTKRLDLNPTEPQLLSLELRKSSEEYKLTVGVKNETGQDQDSTPLHRLAVIVEREETMQIKEIIHSICMGINISQTYVPFGKLGWRNDEGGWSHLLGAVVSGAVDVAADMVEVSMDHVSSELTLTHPIVLTMSNIYLRSPDGGRNRDIFLTTFSSQLLTSVVVTTVLLWFAMLAVTFALCSSFKYEEEEKHQEGEDRVWELTEALLWIVSVLCMQGSPWSPKSLAGSVLLLVSLIFALIIYNSFAAFVTSVLSVRDNTIRNVQDLLESEFKFGYTEDSPEELYLRTTDEAVLRSLYYRGLLQNGGVDDVAEGMSRITNELFAFFASGRIARRALHTMVPLRQRCRIMELPVRSSSSMASIPMAKSSAYTTLIKYWELRLWEHGILPRIRSRLQQPMPTCTNRQSFYGARATDVSTAYLVFFLGWIASFVLLLIEILWSKRRSFVFCRARRVSEVSLSGFQQQDITMLRQRPHVARWGAMEFIN